MQICVIHRSPSSNNQNHRSQSAHPVPHQTSQCRHSSSNTVTYQLPLHNFIILPIVRQTISVSFRAFQDRHKNRLLTPFRRSRNINSKILRLLIRARQFRLIRRSFLSILSKHVNITTRTMHISVRRINIQPINRSSIGFTNSNRHQQRSKFHCTRSNTSTLHRHHLTYTRQTQRRRCITTIRRRNRAPTRFTRIIINKRTRGSKVHNINSLIPYRTNITHFYYFRHFFRSHPYHSYFGFSIIIRIVRTLQTPNHNHLTTKYHSPTQSIPSFITSRFSTPLRHMCKITPINFTLFIHPNRRTSTLPRSHQNPAQGLSRNIFRRPQIHFHLNLHSNTNLSYKYLNSNTRFRHRHTSRHSKIHSLFSNKARNSSNLNHTTNGNLIHRKRANRLQIQNRMPISRVRNSKIIVRVRTRLKTRNNRFSNPLTRRHSRLLNNR